MHVHLHVQFLVDATRMDIFSLEGTSHIALIRVLNDVYFIFAKY